MVGINVPDPNLSQDFYSRLQRIVNSGNYDVPMKLPDPPKPSVANYNVGVGGNYNTTSSSTGGMNQLDRIIKAIKGQESGNNYSARNSMSGASGAYQVMPSNITGSHSGWDWEALGRDVSMSEFMNNPAIQDSIARYKLNQYLSQYGAAGAAVAWYGGPGAVKNMYSKTTQAGGYPSLYDYWQAVLRRMG
jgi:hypothetical protein